MAEKKKVKTFRTKVDKLTFPKGTRVTRDETKDTVGKTEKLLCSIAGGVALFFSEDELEKI